MPQQVNFPGDLASLMPPGTPLASLLPKSPAPTLATPAAAALPATAAAALPAATAPVAPAPASAISGVAAPLMFPTAGLP
jgi:hypothetical protein